MGNRLTDDKTSTNWNYNKNNELQNFDNTTFKYNKNGQLTEKTVDGNTTYYSYNLDGRLKEIKEHNQKVIAQYQYDPSGRRISKVLPQESITIYFHYTDEGLIAEYSETGQLIQSYGYKPNSLFTTNPVFTHRPDFIEEKGYAFFINDLLGTPQKMVLRNGRNVWEASDDAFGKTIIINNEFINLLHFPGQYRDDESFLRYNWNRYYDVQLGRYITADPIGLEGGINGFIYTRNPIGYMDYEGLSPISALAKAIAKSGIKKGLRDYARNRILRRLKRYMTKDEYRNFMKELQRILDSLDDEWWEVCLELPPGIGDMYGAGNLARKLSKAHDALQDLENKYVKKLSDRLGTPFIQRMRNNGVRDARNDVDFRNKVTGRNDKHKGLDGHHRDSVNENPGRASDPRNVDFQDRKTHFESHDNNWQNQTKSPGNIYRN